MQLCVFIFTVWVGLIAGVVSSDVTGLLRQTLPERVVPPASRLQLRCSNAGIRTLHAYYGQSVEELVGACGRTIPDGDAAGRNVTGPECLLAAGSPVYDGSVSGSSMVLAVAQGFSNCPNEIERQGSQCTPDVVLLVGKQALGDATVTVGGAVATGRSDELTVGLDWTAQTLEAIAEEKSKGIRKSGRPMRWQWAGFTGSLVAEAICDGASAAPPPLASPNTSPEEVAKSTHLTATVAAEVPAGGAPRGVVVLLHAGRCAGQACWTRVRRFHHARSLATGCPAQWAGIDATTHQAQLRRWVQLSALTAQEIDPRLLAVHPQVFVVAAAGVALFREAKKSGTGRLWPDSSPADLLEWPPARPVASPVVAQPWHWQDSRGLAGFALEQLSCPDAGSRLSRRPQHAWLDDLVDQVEAAGSHAVEPVPPDEVELDAPVMDGFTLAGTAASLLDGPVLESILRAGANPDGPSGTGLLWDTPLHQLVTAKGFKEARGDGVTGAELEEHPLSPEAAADPILEILDVLLEGGADPCSRNRAGVTPVHEALASWANVPTAPGFVRFNPDAAAAFDTTGLYTVHAQMAHELLLAGCSGEAEDAFGRRPLHIAASSHLLEAVQMLVHPDHGFEVDPAPVAKTGATPLHMLFHHSSAMTGEGLMYAKRPLGGGTLEDHLPQTADSKPMRPIAFFRQHREQARRMVRERRADGSHPTNGSFVWQPSFGQLARQYDEEVTVHIVRTILAACRRRGTDCGLARRGPQGLTPLARATRYGAVASVRAMVLFGADALARSWPAERTPLHEAAARGFLGCVEALLEPAPGLLRADPARLLAATDSLGRTALEYAVGNGFDDVAARLRRYHSDLGVPQSSADERRWVQTIPTAFEAGGDLEPAVVRGRVQRGEAQWRLVADEAATAAGEALSKRLTAEFGECDFETVPASEMTAERFRDEFVAAGRPVLIRDAVNASWPLWRAFLPRGVMKEFPWTVSVGPISYSSNLGWPTASLRVKDYLETYLGDVSGEALLARLVEQRDALEAQLPRLLAPWASEARGLRRSPVDVALDRQREVIKQVQTLLGLWDHAAAPMYVSRDTKAASEMGHLAGGPRMDNILDPESFQISTGHIFFGPALSGTHLHFHPDAINVMLYGSKRWFVLPPADAIFSHLRARDFHEQSAAHLRRPVLQCTQRGGDVAFVPAHWSHNILNLEPSIAAAYEFIARPTDTSLLEGLFPEAAVGPHERKQLSDVLLRLDTS